jgi:DNA polymerase-1
MPTKRLLLVDASSYLYRAFYALPDLRSPAGEPTGAIRGVISMLNKLKVDYPSDYSACVFDPRGKTFRDDIFADYKANRMSIPEDLAAQIAPLKEAIAALGWPVVVVDGVEADDVIGTLAQHATARGVPTVISTGDKDLAQLVDGSVTLVNTMSNETLDIAGVKAKFGVPPERIIDYLALMGDAVDNVPGVDKVGPKTAAKWIAEYGSLDGVVANAANIKGVVGENLRKALAWLPTARVLVTVKCDVALPLDFDALSYVEPDKAQLDSLYDRFGFRTMRDAMKKGQPQEAATAPGAPGEANQQDKALHAQAAKDSGAVRWSASSPHAPHGAPGPDAQSKAQATFIDTRNYQTILTQAQLDTWLEKINAAELTCFDTETTSLDQMQARIVGISFCVTPGEAAYIPLMHRYQGAAAQLDLEATLAKLKPWLEDASKKKVGQNAKYDSHVFANHGINVRGVQHDTLLQSYVLESHQRHDMESLATRHLGAKTISYEEVAGKGASQIGFDQVDIERATQYSAEDADVTLQLHHALYPQIDADAKLKTIYEGIEMPVMGVLLTMERNGVLIDGALLEIQSRELGQKMLETEAKAYEAAGQPFNLGSPKQLGEILYGQMKLPVVKKTPGGAPSTDEEVLAKLAEDYPLPKLLLEYRGLAKLKSTYTDKLPRMVNAKTGRVHTNYGQATAVTGRLASTDPNLQNIPVRTAEGRRIREAFIAPPGSKIISADYSQIELRIMAHLSGDKSLIDAFAKGEDIHRHTAGDIFNVPQNEVTSEQRRYAKVINFGLIYGMSAFGLASNLGIERAAAASYIDRYFTRYPGVAQYMQRTRAEASERGYVETVFGRRLWLPDIRSANQGRRQGAERAAINAPMQGTAADLIKLAMIAVQGWIEASKLQTRLIMQVHDELVLEVPQSELEQVKAKVPELMAGVAKLEVPLVADPGVGDNWDEAH